MFLIILQVPFLGLLIDSKISWVPQILNVKAKLAKCTSVLFKAKHLVDLSTMKLLYNSLFLPYIDYCSEVWGNTYVTKLNCIILLQKRAIRIVANVSKYYHTNELFKQLKLLKFLDHVKFKSGVFMYNAYHFKLPTKLQLLFNKGSNSQHCTRQHNKFKVFYKRTNIKALCVSSKGTSLWNSLPTSIINSSSLTVFKQKLKKYLMRY